MSRGETALFLCRAVSPDVCAPSRTPIPSGVETAASPITTGRDHNVRILPPFPPPPPEALITPTGVPVIVVGHTADGYRVRSPCDNIVEVSDGKPIWSARVVIDPGHGGRHNTGAWGYNGLAEADLNLALGVAVRRELEARGITAVLTRTGDYGTLMSMRAGLADALDAQALVSLHHNAPLYYSRSSPGTEVYIQSDSPSSTRLGGLLYEEISQALDSAFDISWSGTRFTGVSRILQPSGDDLYRMLRLPSTPTALVEYGYLANRAEARLFATPEYLAVAATATADALVAFLETDRPGAGLHEEARVYNAKRASDHCHETPLE